MQTASRLGQNDDYLPLAVNITMTVLDRRAADRLLVLRPNGLTPAEQANIPDNVAGIPDPALRQLLQESARTFYKRVDLINAQVP